MKPEHARQILLLFRPGMTDADEPEMAEALELARQDPALREWFETLCANQEKIAKGFQSITVPEGLREQIVSENPAKAQPFWRKPMLAVALAALAVLIIVTATAKWLDHRNTTGYAAFRQQMTDYTAQGYGMSLTTNDLQAIHGYLAQVKAPADYTLPEKLEKLDVLGCMTTQWETHPVSLICLRTAAKTSAQQPGDVWLFVVDSHVAHDAPATTTPRYQSVGEMGTASWSANGETYLLVAQGGRSAVKELLGDLD